MLRLKSETLVLSSEESNEGNRLLLAAAAENISAERRSNADATAAGLVL